MSSEESDDKYETFVAGVLKDFDSRVQAIQTSAEVNMKGRERFLIIVCVVAYYRVLLQKLCSNSATAYESYCSELKRQLELAQRECEELREELRSKSSEVTKDRAAHTNDESNEIKKLFRSMTCLSVKFQSNAAEEKVYECQLLDGILKGNVYCVN